MPKPRVIEENEDFPIKPRDINDDKRPWGAFDSIETEVSALYILLLMRQKGDWLPFTRDEIEGVYREHGHRNYGFNHLIGDFMVFRAAEGHARQSLDVIVERDGKFYVTDEFVLRYYRAMPIVREKAPTPA